jgi:chromosome partitioning protein
MTNVIAIYHQKGGVGKTTTTHSLGGHLVQAGRRVLCIDMDPHQGLTKLSGYADQDGRLPAGTLHIGQVLGGAINPTADLRRASCPTAAGYDLCPATLDLANTATGLTSRNLGRVEALERAIQREGHRWDYILIDCPPTADVLALNALWPAAAAITPCEPEPLSIATLSSTASILADVEAARGRIIRREIVATRVDTRSHQHQAGLENLLRAGAVVIIPRRNGADAPAQIHSAYAPLAERIIAMEAPNA